MEQKFRICPHFRLNNLRFIQSIKKISKFCEFYHYKHFGNPESLWICCHCSKVGCSLLQVDKCLYDHHQITQHTLYYSFDFQILWCMKCELNLFQMELQLQNFPQSKEHKYFTAALSAAKNIFLSIQKNNNIVGHSILQVEQHSYVFGLKNLGNTCFFNVVLQIVLNSDKFIENLEEKQNQMSKTSFSNQLLEFEQIPSLGNVKNPLNIFELLCKRNPSYSRFQQQDSSECFLMILDMIENDFKINNLQLHHDFMGTYAFQSQCLNCKKVEFSFYKSSLLLIDLVKDNKHEEIKQQIKSEIQNKLISDQKYLKIDDDQINIYKKDDRCNLKKKLYIELENQIQNNNSQFVNLISSYFDFQIYSKQYNGFKCQNCQEQSTYIFHKHYIFNFPQYLSICFKRFDHNFQKNNSKIQIEEYLNLSDYQILIDKQKKDIKYKLYGIINHQGTLNGGHYTCFIFKNKQWYLISDQFFYKVKKQHALNSNVYLAFYEKVDQQLNY